MKIKKLIANLLINVVSGSKELEIKGICSHSKYIAPKDLFIAKSPDYIEEAITSGATAILTDMHNPFLKKEIVQLITKDVAAMEAELASRFFEDPSSKLYCVGITGTNGKTTTGFLIKHLLDKLGCLCGKIGTIEYIIGNFHFEADLTTPDVITCNKLLSEMVKHKCEAVVMEASSHGLVQGRVKGIKFDAAIFTNLTQDHLDYHKTLEEYAEAKSILFSNLSESAVAIINEESFWSAKMIEKCKAKIFSYGFSTDADLFAHQITLYPDHTEFSVTYNEETLLFTWNVAGRFNVLNALAAISLCLSKGYDFKKLPPLFLTFPQVPGRLERVENSLGLNVYIDFAHTPDALECVLGSLREFCSGKLLVVFGAGGNRDKLKRPKMGAAVDRFASFAFITSDNPRSEDPFTICEEISSGFSSKHYLIETDRKKAIECAVKMANRDDLILIAGKGHEPYQTFSHQTIPFDDRQVAYEIISEVRCR